MMKIFFVTNNRHKFSEVKEVFDKFKIEIEQIREDKPEDKSDEIAEVAKKAAEFLANKHKKPIIVDDTGVYFSAYNNFPGAHPKFIFQSIGYGGIFKLLEGKDRSAYFKTAAAYCEPGKKPIVFEAKCEGKISDEVYNAGDDIMPYERIFIPEGYSEVWAKIHDIKREISHRVKAFTKLAEWLVNQSDKNGK